ncbi:MAG: glycosyltransferase family 2 protein [Bacteroidota bacterium]
MDYPLVSIVTVNYDHPEVTCALLGSLRKATYKNIEILVVDNASPNDDPDIIVQFYPEVVFIQSKENLGFAGGNNLAIRQAKGKYVLLLNNDTEVEPGFLEPLVEKCELNPAIGAVSPKIRYYSQPDTLQFTGQAPINPYTIRSYGYGHGQKDNGQFDKDSLTYFVHGAAMMIPMAVIRKVGLMAESYFLYYEELDWGARVRAAGYELWYVHNSMILHKESISTGKLSPFKTYYMNRSRFLYLRRNVRGFTFFIAMLFQVFVAIPKNITVYLFKRQGGHLKAYLNAVSWHLGHMSAIEIHKNPVL